MKLSEVRKLLKEIKYAIIKANDEADYFRVEYLKYCKKQLKAKIRQNYLDRGIVPKDC